MDVLNRADLVLSGTGLPVPSRLLWKRSIALSVGGESSRRVKSNGYSKGPTIMNDPMLKFMGLMGMTSLS